MESASTQEKKDVPETQEPSFPTDEVDAGSTLTGIDAYQRIRNLMNTYGPKLPPRPSLKRETSAPPPPPPSQPPPAPPPELENESGNPTDSMNIPLKQLVSRVFSIKPEARAYDYEFTDAQDFGVEIDEWFHYTKSDQDRDYLLAAREAFEEAWQNFCANDKDLTWVEAESKQQITFLTRLIPQFHHADITTRQRAIATLLYVLSGVWTTTAGVEKEYADEEPQDDPLGNALQIDWMHENADLVRQAQMLQPLHECMRKALEQPFLESRPQPPAEDVYEGVFDDSQYCEISLCFSCFYILLESARSRLTTDAGKELRHALLSMQPNLLVFMTRTISRLRWDESYNIPLMHAVQLLWKSILLAFGDTKEYLERVKHVLQPREDTFSKESSKPILTASPLDYHLFRQEVTSKYPAYNPPLPLIPLEIDQRNILPPLTQNPIRTDGFDGPLQSSHPNGSIMHQPVHIATPAPSPPPSPGGPGGKGGKKQNYQTNQNFPFLYPPLDSASNNIGGKGTTEYQDSTVGRKWEGSSIPESILEAGELFASRMRMTRGMRQLWKERDLFVRYGRGWSDAKQKGEDKSQGERTITEDKLQDPELQLRLDAVESYFHYALPDLQSLIIVMMKIMLTNVQDIAVRNSQLQEAQGGLAKNKSATNLPNTANQIPSPPIPPRPSDMSLEDLDNIRSREISQKAISASLFLLLKWFKISHVLKFEYVTQLLLDSNYIQLTLKYFAHQYLEQLVSFRYDREDLSFWRYCQIHSDHPPLSPTSPTSPASPVQQSDPEDDAVPPPIARHRREPSGGSEELHQSPQPLQSPIMFNPSLASHGQIPAPPVVDELGNPVGETFPTTPIPATMFSTRHLHTSICLVRILQKLTRGKSHRVLLLVSFKSAQILRRILRVPETTLSLYVLKLFKSQVPYCGRKWRQSNMRVITAIYLHCRPDLRDEWLAGMHDAAPGAGMGAIGQDSGEYEEAVPIEWGLRGLTFWWMKRNYSDVMKIKAERNRKPGTSGELPNEEEGGQEIDDEERDFFKRELDAVGYGFSTFGIRPEEEDELEADDEPPPLGAIDEVANGTNMGVSATGGINGVSRQQPSPPQMQSHHLNPEFIAQQQQWAAESPNAEFPIASANSINWQ